MFGRVFLVACLSVGVVHAAEFHSAFPTHTERTWIGPEYWANPLQDWRVANGRLECAVSGMNRNVNLLTHQLGGRAGGFEISVRLGALESSRLDPGWAGFRVGIRGAINDYRYAALRGRGLNAGVTTTGVLFIGDEQGRSALGRRGRIPLRDVELRLTATPAGGVYRVRLAAHDPRSGRRFGVVSAAIPAGQLIGNVALVCEWAPEKEPSNQNSYSPQANRRGGNVRFWFRDWRLAGEKVEAHPDHAWGPILWSMYTLSRGVLKLTAQMPPLGVADNQTVALQVKRDGEWKTIDTEPIHTLARTATFRIADWDASRDVPYRLAYSLIGPDGKAVEHYWEGTIRHDPVEKETLVVAAFTGNTDAGFPNTPILRNLRHHDPDVLFFSGDQIYESVAGYGIQRAPVETAALDYLRKWYLLG